MTLIPKKEQLLKEISDFQKKVKGLTPDKLDLEYYDWEGNYARESQKIPGGIYADWHTWLILAGRGWG